MLSYLLIKFETFDSDAFMKAVKAHDPNGVLIAWNYAGEIKIEHCPTGINLKKTYRYFRSGGWSENRWIKWPSLLIRLSVLMVRVSFQQKVRTLFIGGGDILLWVGQVLRTFGRIERTVTTLEDWSLPAPTDNLYDKINKWKIRVNDRLMTSMETRVIVFNKKIFDERNRYWGGKTLKNSVLYENQWAWFLEQKRKPNSRGQSICLLGTMRHHFGIEILFKLLPGLHQEFGMRLKIIGPDSAIAQEYRRQAEAQGLNDLIDWRGFVAFDQIAKEVDDCFCGLNFQELEVNNSAFVVTGRIVHYLQNLLVPVVSRYSGFMSGFLKDTGMGVVCEPDAAGMRGGIVRAYQDYSTHSAKIENFLTANPYKVEAKNLLSL